MSTRWTLITLAVASIAAASLGCTTTTQTKRFVIPVELDRMTSADPVACVESCVAMSDRAPRAAARCLEACPGTLIAWDATCFEPDVPPNAMCYTLVERTTHASPEGIAEGLRVVAAIAEATSDIAEAADHHDRDDDDEATSATSSTARHGATPERKTSKKRIDRKTKKRVDVHPKRTPARPK